MVTIKVGLKLELPVFTQLASLMVARDWPRYHLGMSSPELEFLSYSTQRFLISWRTVPY